MAKKKKTKKTYRNLVAKFAKELNRSVVFKDKSKYNRKRKHKNQDH